MDWEGVKAILGVFAVIALMSCLIIGVFLAVTAISNNEYKTVIGEIDNVEVYDDYMEISFKDNGTYKVSYPIGNNDFTTDSKIVMRLYNTGFLWFKDDIWSVASVTEIPGD